MSRIVSSLISIAAAAGLVLPLAASAQQQPATSPPPFEKRSYISNMKVLGHSFVGEERGGKMQMMVKGARRYLVQTAFEHPGGWIIDVSDPLKPVVMNDKAFPDGENFQVAWRDDLKKWICMVTLERNRLTDKGLRGVEFWDITDPVHTKLLSSWAVDGGDPSREVQEGSGPHRSYWDGGRYAYISTAPDNSLYLPDGPHRGYQKALQIIDVSDVMKPKLVSNWHVPGQAVSEAAARETSEAYADPRGQTGIHGPVYVPKPVEKGGRYGYGSWGAFGMVIHDLSDPAHPKLVSQWQPSPHISGQGLEVHTIDVTRLNRGFVIVTPEEYGAGCGTPRFGNYVVDVHDPAHPKQIGILPSPVPPADAPYKTYCGRYGRFGTHNAPHLKAPGKALPNFTCYSWFNAGVQCYDISDPTKMKIVGYFVPEQGAKAFTRAMMIRTVDDVFIEWDRKLIWISTDTGNYVLSAPQLGEPVLKPMPVKTWVLDGLNKGHP